MTDYTPTTGHIRFRYWAYGSPVPEFLQATAEHLHGAAFDRWLAAHDRVVAANAWDEAIAAAQSLGDAIGHYQVTLKSPINPYRITEEDTNGR